MSNSLLINAAILFAPLFVSAAPASRSSNFLRLQSSEYVSQAQAFYRDGADGNNQSIALSIDDQWRWRKMNFQFAAKNEYSATEKWNYADIYGIHAGYSFTPNAKISVGRKLERWSEWENEWRQGVFQARYLENKLRPEFAGLTGVFYSQKVEPVSFVLGFLPVYIPDFGAHFSVQDNKFVSKNPWFNPPASQFVFENQSGELRYSVNTPDTMDVISHMGGVAKFEFEQKSYFARLSLAYKPVQQLLLGFPSRRFVLKPQENYMKIEITPRVIYHRVANVDQVVRAGSWTLQASTTYESPDDTVAKDFTSQTVEPAWIYSLGASRALEEEGRYAARMRVGMLKVVGGDAPDKGKFAQDRTLFERRYQFNEAYLLGVNKPWRGVGRFPIDTGIRLVFDRLQNGGLVSFNCGMNFSQELRADFEIDYLGLLGGSAEIEDGFLASYRANDRIGLGLSYVY